MASKRKKTADKMAQYKAASDAGRKGFSEQTLPQRKSPRSKNKSQSPSASNKSKQGPQRETRSNVAVRDEDAVQQQKTSPDIGGFGCLDELTEIPETPPREPCAPGRRRVHAPLLREFETNCGVAGLPRFDEEESRDEESEKPSKKRKVFHTPPRVGKGSSALSSAAQTLSRNEDEAPSRDHTVFRGQDYVPEVVDDELFGPPLKESKTISGAETNHEPKKWPRNGVFIGKNRAAEDSTRAEDSLEVISTSSATIRRMFEDFARKVVKKVQDVQKEQMIELHNVASNLKEAIRTEARNVENVVEMHGGIVRGVGSGKPGAKTSLNEWDRKLDELTPYMDIIFSTDVFARTLAFNTPLATTERYSKSPGTDVQKASLAVQTLLFSLQPGAKKNAYADGIGKLHSEFKFTVMKNTFFNVCTRDTFGLFRPNTQRNSSLNGSGSGEVPPASPGGTEPGTVDKSRITRPSWLNVRSVTVEHITGARKFLEVVKQSRKGKVRETPTANDIATHGALRVYRKLGNHLHQARENVRATFFLGLGYLLIPWKDHILDADQRTLSMTFREGEVGLALQLEDIPLTKVCGINADSNTITAVNTANKTLLNELFSSYPGMVLAVRHDVFVVEGSGGQRKHSGGVKRTLHRLINLVDVAGDFCVEYCRVGSREIFLRTHPTH